MNIETITQKIRARIQSVIAEVVTEVTTEVTKEVVAQLAGAASVPAVKTAARTRRAAPAPAVAKKPRAKKAVKAKPAKAPRAKATKGARYNINQDEVLAQLQAVGESAKAEDVRARGFTGAPGPVFTRALKKLIAAKLVSVIGERRAARYTITQAGVDHLANLSAPAPTATKAAPEALPEPDADGMPVFADEKPSTRLLQDNTHEAVS